MKKYTIIEKDGYCLIENHGGKTIAYSKASGIKIIEIDGYAFKDYLNDEVLYPYADWRLPTETRVTDLASRLAIEDIAGLMLYSYHQSVSSDTEGFGSFFRGTYDGKPLEESTAKVSDLSDQQKKFLKNDLLRHVLVTVVENAEVSAKWNNNMQSFVEGIGFGIPVNISSDPRHSTSKSTEYSAGSGGDISKWPESLGLAATFDPSLTLEFGKIAAKEYRALGIATALSPQIDMATEPRWMRFVGTFGEDSQLSADMARAYCDGFQTSSADKEIDGGWGYESVNAMVKHFPGGGSGEGGRDAHYCCGKYAVYPGNNFGEHLIPFVEGAFKLNGSTKQASAVMPYYTISYNQDTVYNENVGNSYSKYIVTELLRKKYNYDGVVCTDWLITADNDQVGAFLSGKCWGVETESVIDRHYKVIMAGVDQFGGNNEAWPILEAYKKGVLEYGEDFMRNRFEQSARRLLRNIFQTGLFENPYLDPKESSKIVGNPEFMEKGYEAQLKSIILLKNKNNLLPLKKKQKVYIPIRRLNDSVDWFGHKTPAHDIFPVEKKIVQKYFDVVDSPQEADFALVFIESPKTRGYSDEEGYLPISLQYRPYTATKSRKVSIAGGDPLEKETNRSYFGKTNIPSNTQDLDIILETKTAMGKKPVIVSLNIANPTVVAEFEPYASGIIVDFGAATQVIMDILFGNQKPSGLLPFQIPKDMDTVEEQFEDVPHDMTPYTDEVGNTYDFAFGLDFNGVICDDRVKKYRKDN